jgi:prepilin-type N-terminal cleavage/methylation domain-containing protein
MTRARGFTLIELMIGCVLIGMVAASTATFVVGVVNSGQRARGYVDDLDQCRRAVRWVETDLRAAWSVEDRGLSLRLHRSDSAVDYRLTNGVLERIVGAERRIVARRIAALEITQRGRLAEFKLALLPRAPSPRQRAEVFGAVCLRRGDDR